MAHDRFGYRSHADYVENQRRAYQMKRWAVFATEAGIRQIAALVLARTPTPRLGLCHGTRGGQEQAWFRAALPRCEVWGTEIGENAEDTPYTLAWDFHETKPEWIGACDFIYSNAFDHAHDPARALRAWLSCLTPSGLLVLEWMHLRRPIRATWSDPFSADRGSLFALLREWAGPAYTVTSDRKTSPRRYLYLVSR
jgi:hypothetical protein